MEGQGKEEGVNNKTNADGANFFELKEKVTYLLRAGKRVPNLLVGNFCLLRRGFTSSRVRFCLYKKEFILFGDQMSTAEVGLGFPLSPESI